MSSDGTRPRRAALALAGLALAAALPAAMAAGQADADRRVIRADLDGDPALETVSVRAVARAGYRQSRVVLSDPAVRRMPALGPALDRIGRLAVRDFARIGEPQVFMDGSSGASGGFYAAALGRWTGERLRVLWRYDTGHARAPRGTVVGPALARVSARGIRLREVLVPPDEPRCCPSVVRVRTSLFRYRPAAGVYRLQKRVTGPPRRPR